MKSSPELLLVASLLAFAIGVIAVLFAIFELHHVLG
jgi:hypothetical protein